ncbi:uncharacterized protein LOC131938300 [Physella acuta]|uniref:uncharacterized protein LOC131938300 n=1 Tax=Physella acuta TaxID=109671 RepID=UPI0027DBF4E5|nr:uncharacterized protein LOC131938300 [Physella acuta]
MKGLMRSLALAMLLLIPSHTLETGIDKGTVHCSREKGSDVLKAEKGDHGFIVSGGYPGNYSTGGKSGLWCQIHIQVCSTCKLRIKLEELSFAHCTLNRNRGANRDWCHPGCDHIHIHEVDPPYNKVTNRDYFLGNETEYTSISGNIKIRHCAGNTSVEDGKRFKIAYKVVDKNELHQGIVSQYGEVHKTVVSPNFPHGYALNGETFTFVIQNLDPYGHIRLMFEDWDIAPESKVRIYDGISNNANHTVLERFSRPLFVSTSNTLAIVFSTGVHSSPGGVTNDCCYYIGFKAEYQFVSDLEWRERPDTSCSETHPMQGGGMISFTGALSSAPRFYDCVWLIKRYNSYSSNTPDAVVLRLREVLLGDGWLRYGKRNVLEIRNGVSSEARLLARFTSRNLTDIPAVITSQTGLYIRLRGGYYSTDKLSFMFTAVKNVTKGGEGCPGYTDFLCKNLLCIDQELMCDNVDHCGDGSDESPTLDCSVTDMMKHRFKWSMAYITDTTLSNKPACNGILCGDTCITFDQVCNGIVDCAGQEDERDCANAVTPRNSTTKPLPVMLILLLTTLWHLVKHTTNR